jgi:hypothetical protein
VARTPTPDPGYTGRSVGGLGESRSGRVSGKAGQIVVRLDDKEVKQILGNFRKMDKAANDDLRALSRSISEEIAGELRNSSLNHRWYPEQAKRLAESIRVSRDRVPSLIIGGSKRFTNRDGVRVPYGSLLFINEFGSQPSFQRQRFRNQFQRQADKLGGFQGPPRSPRDGRGNKGYWIFPRLKRLQPSILRAWLEGAQRIADIWKDR